jgi:NAD(P)-dependent dehydrogenase (short-subunit alcohol dehydrogenase family)
VVSGFAIFISLTGKHVVVTGGSSGIGLWIAIYAARLGADVTIIARKQNLLGEFNSLHTLNSSFLISFRSIHRKSCGRHKRKCEV